MTGRGSNYDLEELLSEPIQSGYISDTYWMWQKAPFTVSRLWRTLLAVKLTLSKSMPLTAPHRSRKTAR